MKSSLTLQLLNVVVNLKSMLDKKLFKSAVAKIVKGKLSVLWTDDMCERLRPL